jgi:hypothetical protein
VTRGCLLRGLGLHSQFFCNSRIVNDIYCGQRGLPVSFAQKWYG